MIKVVLTWLTYLSAVSSIPQFDPTALLQGILIPADVAVGTIIYRLRAHDPTFEYPLVFSLQNEPTTVSITSLNCTRLNSICQANVVLRRKLKVDLFYDFNVIVQNQRGETAGLNCSFRATNATTPINEIFPGAPTLLSVSESARRNAELGSIIAKGNPNRPDGVLLELWGAAQFGLYQKLITEKDAQATIVLLGALDYETTNVHHLTILANDPWTRMQEDTRNIASWSLLIAVIDEQDTPPIFTLAPPTTTLSPSLLPGDVVLRIHAEDGDRGNPRDIRYGLVPENNPFTPFFNISEETGELRLVRPLNEIVAISHSGQPILLTVIAEEVRTNPQEPSAQSSTVSLALIPPGIRPGRPIFGSSEYQTLLDENSQSGTVLNLPQAEVVAQPGDVVALTLVGNNNTFEIAPSVVEGQSKFEIRVHDPKLLDYEKWHSVQCYIVAREVGTGNFTAQAKLEVLLNDVNDNVPEFSQEEYQGTIQENAPFGTTLLRVEASDSDRAPGSKIKYVRLYGDGSDFFSLDSTTGLVTVSDPSGLDAEKHPKLSFFVEAADEEGKGQTSTASIIVRLIDINDEAPQFEKNVYEFILNHDKTAFTTRAFIKAVDRDISPPNNEIHYELIKPVEGLHLNERTGELVITRTWLESNIVITTARAWDGGVPRLFSECEIRIYPPESHSRRMVFIVPGKNPDLADLQKKLSVLTGAKITINEVRPYLGAEPGAKDVSGYNSEKSVVVATATYSDDFIDVNTVKQVFDEKHTTQIEKASQNGGNLLWLLILLIILALLLAIILILCCICQGCPLYVPPKRRKVVSAEIKKVVRGSGNGKESKSVQVAEWFGRREAWSPEHVDNEAESLQRHEQERGSDRTEARRTIHRPLQREPSREQFYIREGNTDILRLITRGNDQRADQTYYITDSGKDILMRRFIDQQQAETLKQVPLPNSVTKLQTENELLEQSLRQQNALLRQILLERERDLRLETQSLPAGTQTDQDRETQTEPLFLRPPRRRVRSDNDASDGSDDEISIMRARARRRRTQRKIKTPIQEESEVEEKPAKSKSITKPLIRQTRTSELRQKKATALSTKPRNIRKEVLREISASLEHSDSSEEYYTEDSLDEATPRSEKTTSTRHKYHSESDLRVPSPVSGKPKSQSHSDLTTKPKKKPKTKRTARYMEWYNKSSKTTTSKDTTSVKSEKPPTKEDKLIKETVRKVTSRLMQDTESSSKKKVDSKKRPTGPEHPLLQHSEHRFEVRYPRKVEDDKDTDSGIALTRLPIAQKKSIFTIAYDDMHTKQLVAQSPPL
ncbi:cadherin-86C [Tribolium castaneum]|uniref:Cadherin-86C-like Protein n=1 Tax=Tribolium castaneum TaxID=7070 RepID=D6X3I2_TRICA|nr:PREDICTED: cadherin-86C [Tribolium castaneum]EEZ97721.1 Cadherin-86C-like Protein [Tribolium castaneum]|eukprot:XP_972739.1 PREDICTED: cadherin-86C [Tribolium castaneum]